MQSSEENASDLFYLRQPEPVRGCLLALRQLILKQDELLTTAWKYGMPFFCYKKRMCCYLWVDKTSGQPYLGIVEGKHIQQTPSPQTMPSPKIQFPISNVRGSWRN